MIDRNRICPECARLRTDLREARGEAELARLDADQAVADREAIYKALIELGLDGVIDQLEECGVTFESDDS